MILDTLDQLREYTHLHPLFAAVADYVENTNLYELPLGKIHLQGDDIVVNVNQSPAKTKEQAKLETHREYIDIQIPLSSVEVMGYTPASSLPDAPFDTEHDIAFYPGLSDSYFEVKPGMFAIFFPQDGHAPAITPTGLKKIIFKIRK